MCKLVIDTDGTIEMIYRDDLRAILAEGRASIRRASHVEPNVEGKWEAEMVGGPVLGPFETRGEALTAETRWIEERGM